MLNTETSTTISSSPDNEVAHLIENEPKRYKKKGYGLITATLLALSFFFVLPYYGKYFWQWLESSYPKLDNTFVFFFVIVIHTGLYTIGNLGMMVVYKLKHPFFERYKVTNKPWPWETNAAHWRETLKKTLKALAMFHFVIGPGVYALDLFVLKGTHFRLDAKSFPTPWEIIPQMIFFMLVEDFCFYWSHRLLHHKLIYPYIHKKHHEYVDPISISAEYAHPIESIFGNMIPTAMGLKLLGDRVHIFTMMMWTIVRVFETIDGHSGYEFSWSPYRLLPFSGSAKYHDFHHTSNIGNYGSFFTVWDSIMGTNKFYFKHLAKKEKEEKENEMKTKGEPVKLNSLANKISKVLDEDSPRKDGQTFSLERKQKVS